MTRLHNKPELGSLRKKLRTHGTSAEAVLWGYLKKNQVDSLKFRRQHSIGPFVIDFYCPVLKLAIELDGAPHGTAAGEEHDSIRDLYLASKGITVLHFENRWVFEYPQDIIEAIREIKSNGLTTPSPDRVG